MPASEPVRFATAVPVWPKGRECETNSFYGFRADFTLARKAVPVLRIAAATVYRVYVNGRFVGHGPVRSPHGFFRADEWPLGSFCREGGNAVAVEVSNYNLPTFNCAGTEHGFLLCEVTLGDAVLCATGTDFTCLELPRVRNTSKLTPQRSLVEMYRLAPGWDRWRTERGVRGELPARRPDVRLLPRHTPYPHFDVVRARAFETTEFDFDDKTPPARPDLAYDGHDELKRLRDVHVTETSESWGRVGAGRGFAADFGRIDSGFLGFEVECSAPCRIYAVYDEVLADGIPDPMRHWGHDLSSVWEFTSAGRYAVEMVEPTSLRYVHIFARSGEAKVGGVFLREYKNPRVYSAEFACSDARLNRVFEAARETCSQCTMDSSLDNPDRERNSGPCDAFFTLGAYSALSGDYGMERLLFENYATPASYPIADNSMLPWCYPADFPSPDVSVIPPYVPWFLIELERYTAETGDVTFRDALRERLLKMPASFGKFANADGLIERLPWWTFLDWSMAGAFTQDVSYPVNAIWAEGLDVLARLYGKPEFHGQAEALRTKVRQQSFDGRWYRDHAVREENRNLRVCDDVTELCQYYMLMFGVASPAKDPAYWRDVVDSLGRYAPGYGKITDRVWPANYFEGLMLRHLLLSRSGMHRQAVRELGYLTDMSDVSGTLWECYPGIGFDYVANGFYSCCQGFASYAATLILRSALGIGRIDRVHKCVSAAVPDNGLRSCRGSLPTDDGPIAYAWSREKGEARERLELPKGWTRAEPAAKEGAHGR